MAISPTIFIIPTGIGCEIGGFAGDALPAAKLLASASGCLITHPNVMNGGTLSEKAQNIFYVEGYSLDRFAKGEIIRWSIIDIQNLIDDNCIKRIRIYAVLAH